MKIIINRKTKIRIDNWWKQGECKQIGFIPHFQIFWAKGICCISFGWLILNVELWMGNVKNI